MTNFVLQDPLVVAGHQVVVMLVQQQWPLVKPATVMVCLEMVPVHQPVLPERLVAMLVEVPALEPQVLYQAQPRSSVHCAKNGLRIHILSSVPPSLITSSASPALGIVLRGRGLGPRWVVLIDIWQYCLRGVYGTDSICAKWFSNIFVVILYIKKISQKNTCHLNILSYVLYCLKWYICFFPSAVGLLSKRREVPSGKLECSLGIYARWNCNHSGWRIQS